MIGNFLQSWTSTGYFSNSTASFVTNCRFSPIIDAIFQFVRAMQLYSWALPVRNKKNKKNKKWNSGPFLARGRLDKVHVRNDPVYNTYQALPSCWLLFKQRSEVFVHTKASILFQHDRELHLVK